MTDSVVVVVVVVAASRARAAQQNAAQVYQWASEVALAQRNRVQVVKANRANKQVFEHLEMKKNEVRMLLLLPPRAERSCVRDDERRAPVGVVFSVRMWWRSHRRRRASCGRATRATARR